MIAILEAIVALLGQIVPAVGGNATLIDSIIETLAKILPEVVSTAKDLAPPVQNIIAALKGTDGITQAQWDALDALQTQADADFEKAAADEGFGSTPPPETPSAPPAT